MNISFPFEMIRYMWYTGHPLTFEDNNISIAHCSSHNLLLNEHANKNGEKHKV